MTPRLPLTAEGRITLDGRGARIALQTLTGLLMLAALFVLWTGLTTSDWARGIGNDRTIYVDAARRWLDGGSFYLGRQLSGPYDIKVGDTLYPPTALWFLVPMSFLPAVVWWIVPVAIILALVAQWRPAMWAWPLIAACMTWPPAIQQLVTGNPAIWIAAAVAAGLQWGWPGALVLLKPSVFPFALVGIRKRSWWVTAGLVATLSIPLVGMFPDWFRAVFDGRGWGGLLYSVRDVPLLLLPVMAWIGRKDRLRNGGAPQRSPARALDEAGGTAADP